MSIFIDIFNAIDGILADIIETYKSLLILDYGEPKEQELLQCDQKSDMELLKSVLRFTALVLSNSIDKGIYNSVEVS